MALHLGANDVNMVQLMPLPHYYLLLRHVAGAGLLRLC